MQAVKRQHSFGVAEVILFLSIAILVIVVVVPVALIFFNAFFVDGQFNAADVVKTLSEGETYQALLNSLFIASGVTSLRHHCGHLFAWLVTRTDIPYKGFMKSMFGAIHAAFVHRRTGLENAAFGPVQAISIAYGATFYRLGERAVRHFFVWRHHRH